MSPFPSYLFSHCVFRLPNQGRREVEIASFRDGKGGGKEVVVVGASGTHEHDAPLI